MGLGSSEARRAFLDGPWRVRVDVEPLRRQIRDHCEDEQADRRGAVDGDATCVRTHAGPVAFGAASWGGEKTYGAKRQIILPIPAAILKGGKWEPFDVRAGKFD